MSKLIGEILLEKGIISHDQLKKALEIQTSESATTRRQVGKILFEDLGIDRHAVLQELTAIFAIREMPVTAEMITEEQINFITEILDNHSDDFRAALIRNKIIPYQVTTQKGENVLTILCADPTNTEIKSLAGQLPYPKYEIVYDRLENLDGIINKCLSSRNEFFSLLDEIEYEDEEGPKEEVIDEAALDAEINQSALTTLVEGILVEAVRQGVSDIHIVPQPGNITDFNLRRDGKLSVYYSQKGVKPEAIAAVFKDKTRNVDRFERDIAQDGFIQKKVDGYLIRYRVSIVPIVGSEFDRKLESIVIRILDDRKVITDLRKLGLQKQALDDFKRAINKPSGIVIVTGPTGSGKSTTLVAALYSVISPEKCVLTVEEPVEYLINGARQLKISDKMNFDLAIRAILRHDPDIVLVGEIRDLKTAEIAIKLANTGHLTFSTLHTNDAPSAISRLYKMGIEPFLIAYSVNIIMAQRLVRKLCDACKRPIEHKDVEAARLLGFTDKEIEETTFYEAVGCNKCRNGYKGRIAIMEALYFTKEIRRLIVTAGEQVDEEALRTQAIKEGMLTLRVSGRERIKEGVTTIEEVAAVTVED
ncbi:MAG: pilus assembly protein PilB [Candidatus Marinimicrobia bacterium CG08_land_8_20_14_0_20_45_22]|nr:MAG: pilus assembly protein PilB [Candidatus Marinimicrobia bacterium CG08_land_8_20_14_0_20_45_22]